jgi:hypothetical protein
MEKCDNLFSATDYVRVINPDTEAYVWQFMNPAKERIEFDTSSSTVPQKITYREAPEVYKLEPGQSAALPGSNARVMMDGLVKKLMVKRTISRTPNVKPGEARNFNFSDDSAQQHWINEIYLGKANPFVNSTPSEPVVVHDDVTSDIDKDLGIEQEPVKRTRKPRTAAA